MPAISRKCRIWFYLKTSRSRGRIGTRLREARRKRRSPEHSGRPRESSVVASHRLLSSHRFFSCAARRSCQPSNTGEYCAPMREGIRDRCELGRIWLTEDELKRTLYSVTYLRRGMQPPWSSTAFAIILSITTCPNRSLSCRARRAPPGSARWSESRATTGIVSPETEAAVFSPRLMNRLSCRIFSYLRP
jgi:hypothetical protein